MELNSILALRKSTRAYLPDRQVSREDLEAIVLAGNSSPIGKADYESLHLTVIRNPALLARIDAAAAKGMGDPGLKPLYGAPALILVAGRDGIFPNIEYANAACIVENMHLKATELGLASVYLWGFARGTNADAALLADLRIPEGFRALSALAVGYPVEGAAESRKLTLKIDTDYLD